MTADTPNTFVETTTCEVDMVFDAMLSGVVECEMNGGRLCGSAAADG